jgi:hypothetical protein
MAAGDDGWREVNAKAGEHGIQGPIIVTGPIYEWREFALAMGL